MRTLTILILAVMVSCNQSITDSVKQEIESVETQFQKLAEEKGVSAAFLHFAADDAVLNRNNTVIKGKDAIAEYFKKHDYDGVKLAWKPDFVDVSKSGDMAYTYGKYTLTIIDSAGESKVSNGIFHTVWKKQKDGSWKFVWD